MSTTSTRICSMRCRVPIGRARPGSVTSTASAPMRASSAAAASVACALVERRLERDADLVGDLADGGTLLGGERAEPAQDRR